MTAELSSCHKEQQCVGRDSSPARRGFALPHSSCRHQSICKQRCFCFPSCSEEMGAELWPHDGRVICVLFCSALPSNTSQLQHSAACSLQ